MQRAFYADSFAGFLGQSEDSILGALTRQSGFAVDPAQRDAWTFEIAHLRGVLPELMRQYGDGLIQFEYSIPRMGRRVDVLVLLKGVLFVLEYKVGERKFPAYALDQVVDYALDLKNFHETSHHSVIAPILIATEAPITVVPQVVDAQEIACFCPQQRIPPV